MRVREILELTRARVLTSWREPEAIFWVFGFPLFLCVVLGMAFRGGTEERSRVCVLLEDSASAPTSQRPPPEIAEETRLRVTRRLSRLATLEVKELDPARARALLRSGGLDALVWCKPTASGPEDLRVVLDPERQESLVARDRLRLALRPEPVTTLKEEERHEKGARYIDFLFPGILGMNLMGTGVWAIAFALADMRQKKFLRRMLVTPMSRSAFLASFVLYRLAFLVAEVTVLLLFALLVLKVPMNGSWIALTVLVVTGGLGFGALGLLAASRVRTIEGTSGLVNLILLPMWLGSGTFFSYERFPEEVHALLRVLPLTALNDGLRAVMLEGAGLAAVSVEVTLAAAWGVGCGLLALRLFRWE